MEFVEELDIEDIEIQLLLTAIKLKYGYDFLSYSGMHIKRRVRYRLASESHINSISELQHEILYNREMFEKLLKDFSINVTEMFRDPKFYLTLREEILPILQTYPFIKIWHAGCSSGEEVYSMAILLMEEGLYDRTQIYATDFNDDIIKIAKEGIYSIDKLREYTYNYQLAGGKEDFSNYYRANYNYVKFDEGLKKNILFSNHNLATDKVFGEMNLILCRNVIIYFNRQLQTKVIELFSDSLIHGGYLGLGLKESLKGEKEQALFEQCNVDVKIYKKLGL